MRCPTSAAAALCLLATACGTWSNEDLRFLEALPTREELRVEVPAAPAAAGGPAGVVGAVAVPACGALGSADTWGWAKPTSDHLNASIDAAIGLVDLVRRYPPTTRLADGRVWGPFDDDKHPGVQLRIVILRSFPAGPDGPVEHAYAFEARRPAEGGDFLPILSGSFVGPSALRGSGSLVLAFQKAWDLRMADPDAPHGEMRVTYDRSADPRTVQLALVQAPGFGLLQFAYGFKGYADGRGRLGYAFVNAAGDRAEVGAGFDAAGAGQAAVTYYPASAPGLSASFHQCWNASSCLVYSDDVNGYSCGGGACAGGVPSDCPPVPAP
jgi:hypothetical protein